MALPSLSPILGPALRRRQVCLALFGVGVAQVVLTAAGMPSWPCPLKSATGIPCPGCGMSRAVGALCKGHVREAMHLHALAPLVLVGILLLVLGAVLPASARTKFATIVQEVEAKTRLVPLLLALLLVYYLWRLMYRPDEVARIVAG